MISRMSQPRVKVLFFREHQAIPVLSRLLDQHSSHTHAT